MVDQIVITFPEISDASWSKILEEKIIVDVWDGLTRKTSTAKWSGSKLSNEIVMYFDFPDNMIVISKEDENND